MDELKKIRLYDVESMEINDNDSVIVARPDDTDGEIIKVPISSVFEKYRNEHDVSIKTAYSLEGHLILELSDGSIIDAGIVGSDGKKYGVCYDMNTKNPKLTRLGDAKYMRAEISDGKSDTKVVNDFDNAYPWCDIKRCTVAADGTVTSYEGDPNYTENGSIGEVLTEIPEHYRMTYISEATGKMYHYVSREKINEHYKFVPKTYIGSFLMTINADGSGESRAGAIYYYDKYAFKNAQATAQAKGSGWHQFDIRDYETIKTLFLIEFATLDSQSVYPGNDSIPYMESVYVYPNEECAVDWYNETTNVTDTEFTTNYFVTENNSFMVGDELDIEVLGIDGPDEFDSEIEGEYYALRTITSIEPADPQAYPDLEGYMSIYRLSGKPITIGKETIINGISYARNGQYNRVRDKASSVKFPYHGVDNAGFIYRGIENFLSVSYTWIDGILIYNNQYWVCDNPDDYQFSVYVLDENGNATEEYQYKPLSFNHPASTGYITKMGYDEESGLTLPIESGGASDIGYCDQFTKPRNLTSTCTVRWGTDNNTQSGLFYLYCHLTTANLTDSPARLSYRHSQ